MDAEFDTLQQCSDYTYEQLRKIFPYSILLKRYCNLKTVNVKELPFNRILESDKKSIHIRLEQSANKKYIVKIQEL
jgi:hypothetical protein